MMSPDHEQIVAQIRGGQAIKRVLDASDDMAKEAVFLAAEDTVIVPGEVFRAVRVASIALGLLIERDQ